MTPQTEQELADVIASAKGPLRISGGGTRPIGNPVVGEALSTSGLSGISLYEPGALTIVAQAGTPVAEIEAALDSENQRLAFEPMDHRAMLGTDGVPTIGGVVSGNISGSRRISVGACRDHMLGVRFVDGAGVITKNGGRVMKNVTGYDLVKLLSGAYGTLGVLTEVSLKVLPKPETSATLYLNGLDLSRAVEAMSKALGSPYEVTGAAYNQAVSLRIEGFEASVVYRMGQLKTLLAEFGDLTEQPDKKTSEEIWDSATNVHGFSDAPAVWRISVKPSETPAFIDVLQQMHGFDYALDWGGGLIWLAAYDDHLSEAAHYHQDSARHNDTVAGAEVLHTNLQHNAGRAGGHTTLIKAPDAVRAAVPVFQPENSTVTALSKGLRAQFDPRGILNAGLMG